MKASLRRDNVWNIIPPLQIFIQINVGHVSSCVDMLTDDSSLARGTRPQETDLKNLKHVFIFYKVDTLK